MRVVVVGAGPAGLLAAGEAARLGAEVILLEKKDRPGIKLSITGKGRCNITNIAPIREFIDHFGKNGKFLYSAFSEFFSDELLTFLESFGVQTKIERGGRVFPASDRAGDVVDGLVKWATDLGVQLRTNAPVKSLKFESGRSVGVELENGEAVNADVVIIATGGASYPGTGSTGDGYRLARQAGHRIVDPRPALVGLETVGTTAQDMQGLSLKNVRVDLYIDGKKRDEAFGEMLFTHFGVSGPVILTLSGQAVDALRDKKSVELGIDLKPALEHQTLDARLLRELDEHGKQHLHNTLKSLLPSKIIPVCLASAGLSDDKPCSQVSADERKRLRLWLKDFRLKVERHRSLKEAIVTAGGVHLKEIQPKTMKSRLVQGLYFAGEVMDVHADTGGYNLQAAFSTGWLAGVSAGGA